MSLYDSNHACEKCGRGLRASTPPWLCERCDPPTSPPPWTEISACTGKTVYKSKAEAIRVIEHRQKAHRMRPAKTRGAPHVYKCGHCHNFHIGGRA